MEFKEPSEESFGPTPPRSPRRPCSIYLLVAENNRAKVILAPWSASGRLKL